MEKLLRRFYGRVLVDDVLAKPFAELQIRGLDSHIPVMCDFWETVLFRAGLYRGSALHAHRHVHHQTPLERASLRLLADHVGTRPSMRCTADRSPNTRRSKPPGSPGPCTGG